MIHEDTKEFTGISVTKAIVYAEHEAAIRVGILSNGSVWDGASPPYVEWAGSLENTLEQIADLVMKETKAKGVLAVGMEEVYGVIASVVRGEVRQDADVKWEIYHLMGITI